MKLADFSYDLPAEAIYYLVDSVRDLYDRRAKLKLNFISPPASGSRGGPLPRLPAPRPPG